MWYFVTASIAAIGGYLLCAAMTAGKVGDLQTSVLLAKEKADYYARMLQGEADSRTAIENELLALQARAYVRNAKGQLQRLTADVN